jgi:hypothetical protein
MHYYHGRTYNFLDRPLQGDPEVAAQIAHVEATLKVKVPAAVAEWLQYDPDGALFQTLTHFPHYSVTRDTLARDVVRQHIAGQDVPCLTVCAENQGVWAMMVRLNEGDNPSVWVSEDVWDKSLPEWHLHSHSFTDAILAFAWDFVVCAYPDYRERFIGVVQQPPISSPDLDGPTTYRVSAWFRAATFWRRSLDGRLATFMAE